MFDYNNFCKIKEYNSSWIGPGEREFCLLPTTLNKNSYYDDQGYLITDSVGDLRSINKKIDFTYKINKHGFRSNHFKPVDSEKITILTAGCSHSFGEALPEELRWQNFLLKSLKYSNLEWFDVSSMGASFRLVTRNVISFIRNYGKPNYVFIVFPDVARDFMFNDKENKFNNVNSNTRHIIKQKEHNIPQNFIDYTLSFNYYDALMKAIEYIWYLEEFCKTLNIKLYWTSWDNGLEEIFKNLNFKNFVEQKWQHGLNIDNLEYWDMANDNLHRGSSWTSWQGKSFSEVMLND
jgi:hypothetical protein